MAHQSDLTEHRTKANIFLRKANKYKTSDEVVSKICAFYAAYHAMRVAILTDPILDKPDEEIQQLVHMPGLRQDSRYATHHSGRHNSGRGIGQNEVVQALYRFEAYAYGRLHRASVDARYLPLTGEIILDATEAYIEAERIVQAALSGQLKWAPKSTH